MQIETYSYGVDDLNVLVNQTREVFLNSMVKQELLTQEQMDKISQYSIVIAKKSFFGKFWDKLWKKENDRPNIFVVKIIE